MYISLDTDKDCDLLQDRQTRLLDREDVAWQTKSQLPWLHPKSGLESWRGWCQEGL